VLAVESLAALRTQAASAPAMTSQPSMQFPAQDTPLRIPAEVERLRSGKERPIRA